MDTKERKTPAQDTRPAPGSVCRTQKLATGTATSGKNRIRKTGINFKGIPKKFWSDFPAVNSGLMLMKGSLATWLRPRRASASAGVVFGQQVDRRAVFGNAQ
jgi:hypothetical protein